MPTDDRIEAARDLAADGRFRDAVDELRAAIADDPHRDELRIALAEMYRERGYPDQAGRWGVVVPGWATDRELRSFARSFPPGAAPERIAAVLHTTAEEVPPAFVELVRASGRADSAPTSELSLETVAGGVAVLAFFILVVVGVIVFVESLFALGNPTTWSRIVAASFGFLGALSCLLWLVRSLVKSLWRSAVVSLMVAVALGALSCWVVAVQFAG